MAQFFEVHPDNPHTRLLKKAVSLLERGGILRDEIDLRLPLAAREAQIRSQVHARLLELRKHPRPGARLVRDGRVVVLGTSNRIGHLTPLFIARIYPPRQSRRALLEPLPSVAR